jgi:hypothetical protein
MSDVTTTSTGRPHASSARRSPALGDAAGAVARPLLWLAAGLLLFAAAAVAIAPELLQLPGRTTELFLLIVAAGIPGLLLLIVLIPRRRRVDASLDARGDDGRDDPLRTGAPDRRTDEGA